MYNVDKVSMAYKHFKLYSHTKKEYNFLILFGPD